ncbi:MAG: NIPSNAP family protein [Rhodobacteraceae bacterium]|nr:NIPSNAP family protein [Paracoccaceae bacterium]
MIYELRDYTAMPGRLGDLQARFQNVTLPLWERHGIRPIGFWTVLVGTAGNNRLYYILQWESLAERETVWNRFMSDPEWLGPRAKSEANGPLVQSITNSFLQPTAFSPLQ